MGFNSIITELRELLELPDIKTAAAADGGGDGIKGLFDSATLSAHLGRVKAKYDAFWPERSMVRCCASH